MVNQRGFCKATAVSVLLPAEFLLFARLAAFRDCRDSGGTAFSSMALTRRRAWGQHARSVRSSATADAMRPESDDFTASYSCFHWSASTRA